jgi:DNA-binding IscR family transcriptional regulator
MQAKGEEDCPFRSDCPVRSKWGRVQVAMLREMAAITFEALAQEALGVPVKIPVTSLL